jgi:hypothetical protein
LPGQAASDQKGLGDAHVVGLKLENGLHGAEIVEKLFSGSCFIMVSRSAVTFPTITLI